MRNWTELYNFSSLSLKLLITFPERRKNKGENLDTPYHFQENLDTPLFPNPTQFHSSKF